MVGLQLEIVVGRGSLADALNKFPEVESEGNSCDLTFSLEQSDHVDWCHALEIDSFAVFQAKSKSRQLLLDSGRFVDESELD